MAYSPFWIVNSARRQNRFLLSINSGVQQPLHNRVKMQRRAIDVGKVSILLVEQHRKISPSQNDRLDSIPRVQSMSDGTELRVLLFSAFSLARQLHIRAVNGIHFVRPRLNELHPFHESKKRRLHHETGAKERDPPRPSCRKLFDERF